LPFLSPCHTTSRKAEPAKCRPASVARRVDGRSSRPCPPFADRAG
jgi:hypothetical protein